MLTQEHPQADKIIDAVGKIVSPGFIDIHMHEDPVENGVIYRGDDAISYCMLRMGVTTALAGQCGENVYHPADYLDLIDKNGFPINLGMMAGHEFFRNMVGCTDKYAAATTTQKQKMKEEIEKALDRGCLGLSYGIRYIPGIDVDELLITAQPCVKSKKVIAAHIRDDAAGVFDAARELLDTGKKLRIPVQVSHIGSMAGFGQMEEFLKMIDEYKLNGLDVSCDCYPYYAFSTGIGETTYDAGWMERYDCDYSAVEISAGKYKGQRCNREIFDELRKNDPECITVCYVMKEDDVNMAIRHPAVMLCSDGVLDHGQGHPRAAGAFPRMIAEFVRTGNISLYNAIEKMTSMPAEKLGLLNKGRLNVGADADIVIFDYQKIKDEATFERPTLAPKGLEYILVNGEVAVNHGEIVKDHLGKAIRKRES